MTTESESHADCECLQGDFHHAKFERRELGTDTGYGEASLDRCKRCGRYWLDYLMEYEYLTAAGRWFRGTVPPEVADTVTAESATAVLETLESYFRGGSAFGGQVIRTQPGQLKYWLAPFRGPMGG